MSVLSSSSAAIFGRLAEKTLAVACSRVGLVSWCTEVGSTAGSKSEGFGVWSFSRTAAGSRGSHFERWAVLWQRSSRRL